MGSDIRHRERRGFVLLGEVIVGAEGVSEVTEGRAWRDSERPEGSNRRCSWGWKRRRTLPRSWKQSEKLTKDMLFSGLRSTKNRRVDCAHRVSAVL